MNEQKKAVVLAVNGMLGKGFPIASFEEGMKRNPDIIGVDAGSVDGGPSYLATGLTGMGLNGIYRDLKVLIPAALESKTPLVIGSAGTAGGKIQVELLLDYFKQIKEELSLRDFKVAVIYSDIPKEYVKQKLDENRVKAMPGFVPEITHESIDEAIHIVGQMGIDPFVEALEMKPDVILTGRACDTAIYAAYPVMIGLPMALSKHAAKIIECGTLCATPPSGGDCMLATITENEFFIETLNPKRGVTPLSIAAHTMYENDHPSKFIEPEGLVDCSETVFEQVTPSCVRCYNTKHVDLKPTIKIEGSSMVGYRSIAIISARDKAFIQNYEYIKKEVLKSVEHDVGSMEEEGYQVKLRTYGIDGTLQGLETETSDSHEVCIIIDILAKNQQDADDICSQTRNQFMHKDYPGRKTVGGNIASCISPLEIPVGPVFEFSIFHVMEVDSTTELFPVTMMEV